MPSHDSTGKQLSGAAKRRRRVAPPPGAGHVPSDTLIDLAIVCMEAIAGKPITPAELRGEVEAALAGPGAG